MVAHEKIQSVVSFMVWVGFDQWLSPNSISYFGPYSAGTSEGSVMIKWWMVHSYNLKTHFSPLHLIIIHFWLSSYDLSDSFSKAHKGGWASSSRTSAEYASMEYNGQKKHGQNIHFKTENPSLDGKWLRGIWHQLKASHPRWLGLWPNPIFTFHHVIGTYSCGMSNHIAHFSAMMPPAGRQAV